MRFVRVLIGYVLACLAAALTLVLFVYTPAELASLPLDMGTDRMAEAGFFVMAIAPLVATFAALPALIGVIFGERRSITSWTYYALLWILIAALGFLGQHFSEAPGEPTILRNYALTAFLVAGFIAGFVYWLSSGRFVGTQGVARPDFRRTTNPSPPASGAAPGAVADGV
jgi:hypothetical protein